MTRETREIFIGAATVFGLIAVLVFMNARNDFLAGATGDALLVTAKFNKVDGLGEGSEVRLGGIRVGSVTKMYLDKKYRAVVRFKINAGIELPIDSSAAIHTDGLFGSKFVVIEPGGDSKTLKSGGEFRLSQDAMVVGDLLDLIISEGHVARDKAKSAAKQSGTKQTGTKQTEN